MNEEYFFIWYQYRFSYLYDDDYNCLMFLFGTTNVFFLQNNKEWAQNCLDFLYRVFKCNLCEIDDTRITPSELMKLFSQNDPSTDEGSLCWYAYQIGLTEGGRSFLKDCGIDGDTKEFSPFFKERLSALFDAHGVGFDKSNFIPVQF